jgi:transcription antitermination factor NusG
MNTTWYIIYTKSRCEKKVASLLSKRGIENFCPLNRVVRKWSDRIKLIYEPLFNSYVFVRTTEKELFSIKQVTSDIVNFVYWLGKPAVINDVEIEGIKNFLNKNSNVQLEKNNIKINDEVRIIDGALSSKVGNIAAIEHNKLKLILPSLGYVLVALSSVETVVPVYQSNRVAIV